MRRKLVIFSYAGLTIIALLGVGAGAIVLLGSGKKDLVTRLTEVGVVLSGGTVALAFIAGLIALQAYAAATGMPKIEFQIWFKFSLKNCPVFQMDGDSGEWHTDGMLDQTTAMVFVRNRSSYSARNPSVMLSPHSFKSHLSIDSASQGWNYFSFPDEAISEHNSTSLQWDGSANFSIHGHSARRLPDVTFGELSYNPESGPSWITVEIAADGGYRRTFRVPVRFQNDDGKLPNDNVAKSIEWL